VEFLKSGGSMEELQILLGHKSIEITKAHYAPRDPSRAKKLDQSIAQMHALEPNQMLPCTSYFAM
jgi:hypothetical protein